MYRPSVGYCQGMSFVVAVLLFVTRHIPTTEEEPVDGEYAVERVYGTQEEDITAEEDTFWVLHYLIEKVLPPAYFGAAPNHGLPQLQGLQRSLLVIHRLVESR